MDYDVIPNLEDTLEFEENPGPAHPLVSRITPCLCPVDP